MNFFVATIGLVFFIGYTPEFTYTVQDHIYAVISILGSILFFSNMNTAAAAASIFTFIIIEFLFPWPLRLY